MEQKANPWALLPIMVFLVLFIGAGIILGDFYAMPAVVSFMIALIFAFLQNPSLSFSEKLSVVTKGMGNQDIMIMTLIFILAGAFSASAKAAGGVESTVNFCLSFLPGNIAIAGLFVVACFISISMGTSVGTISALASIALGISEKSGIGVSICIAAVVCGAMFGDNLSMISDTTIAAVRTQGCEIKDKFKENFVMVLPAAIITIVLFLIVASNSSYQVSGDLEYNLFRIIPYLVVLIGALMGVNVFLLLVSGSVISLGIGIFYGDFTLVEAFKIVGDGFASMYEIAIISLLVAGIVALIRENGGIIFILNTIKKRISSKKGAEFGIAAITALTDFTTANNTVAIVVAGPIVKEIGTEYGISPRRTASLVDIFSSVVQGVIPYGIQLLNAASLCAITPFMIMPYLFYPVLMAVSALLFIFFRPDSK